MKKIKTPTDTKEPVIDLTTGIASKPTIIGNSHPTFINRPEAIMK